MLSNKIVNAVLKGRKLGVSKQFANISNVNLLLINEDNEIIRKFGDLKNILEVLTSLTKEVNFVVIKMQPIITHLGNDVDLLTSPEEVPKFIEILRSKFQIRDVDIRERISKGFKATLYLQGMKLDQIDIYTYIGWRGYLFIEYNDLRDQRVIGRFEFFDRDRLRSLELPILKEPYAFYVDILHTLFGNGYITLGDLVKLLVRVKLGCLRGVDVGAPPPIVGFALRIFTKTLKYCLDEILAYGRCTIPVRYALPYSIISSISNLFANKEVYAEFEGVNAYWMEFRRVLNVAHYRLLRA